MKRSAAALLMLSFTLLPSCLQQQQLHQQEEPEKKETGIKLQPPMHLGAVHQVYPEQGFALLRIIGPIPGPGSTLITHPADGSTERMGNLRISDQLPARNSIVAADIRSGTVLKGDRVFRYRNIAAGSADADSQNTGDDIIAAEPPPGVSPEGASDTTDSTFIEYQPEATIPEPELSADAGMETSVLPTSVPAAPGSDPGAPSAPASAPGYLDSIPDNINDWDSM